MTKLRFALLAVLGIALATVAIGIRGLDNWRDYELVLYYGLIAWTTHMAHRRYVRPVTA